MRPVEILSGMKEPTTWGDLLNVRYAPEMNRHLNGGNLLVHALRCYFASGNDMSFCVHYIPKDPNREQNKDRLLDTRQPYRGDKEIRPTPGNVWKTCGIITAVTPHHVHILDRSEKRYKLICSEPHTEPGDPPRDHYSKKLQEGDACTRKPGCPGHLVRQESWSEKQLIIDNIINITDASGLPIDFAPVLKKYLGYDVSQNASLEKINKLKTNKEKNRKEFVEEHQNVTNNADVEAALSPEDRKQQFDYWSYYDPEYAKKMIKDY